MQKTIFCALGMLLVSLLLPCGSNMLMAADNHEIHVIPKPDLVSTTKGCFIVNPNTVIYISNQSEEMKKLGMYLAEQIGKKTGHSPKITTNPHEIPLKYAIILSLKESFNSLGDEGYNLRVSPYSLGISAPKSAGLFYGIQTMRQMLTKKIEKLPENTATGWCIPCVKIDDKPRYRWRGMLLDCSRHFMTVDFIKRYIDLLAYHRMNVFHWHLTDDQGWRLEIKRYPRLTEIGAWRDGAGNRYGGFYTQEEVRDIVAHAKTRYITFVPEIEMPGHATAALAAYPEISCTGTPIDVETEWGIHANLFCAGKEETFDFIRNVLTEVCDLFPSEYIHIGGDEAKKDQWKVCPHCQKRIKDEGLENENELQGYFTGRIDAFMQTLGRRIIGWDEILEGGISTGAVVQSWRGMEGAAEGSQKGHYVISSPHDYTYFDYPMFSLRSKAWWMGITPLEKTYSFNPTPEGFTAEQAAYIMGGECAMWSEYAPQPEIDQQVFPRLCAISEVHWTAPEKRDFNDFSERMKTHYRRLDELGVDYYKPDTRIGGWNPEQISETPEELEWDISEYTNDNGHYRLTFDHEEGSHGIAVEWAALFKDEREISRDTHSFKSSDRNLFQTYRFSVDNYSNDAVYTLKVFMSGNGGTDTRGSLWLKCFK